MTQDLQAVFYDLRTMANNALAAADEAGAQYPWEAIREVEQDYNHAKTAGDSQRAKLLALAGDTLSVWYEALQHLGNTLIPGDVAGYPWHFAG